MLRSKEEEELLLEEDDITEAFRLSAASTAAEPEAGECVGATGCVGVSTPPWGIMEEWAWWYCVQAI